MLVFQKSQPSNLDELAVLHQACFPDSLSRQLGLKYARKTLKWFLSDANRFLLHVENDGKIAGYVGGFISQYPGDGSTSGMLRYAMGAAVRGVVLKPWMVFNKQIRQMYPLIFKNMYRKIYPDKKIVNTVKKYNDEEKKAGLVVIGVHPQFRGKGVFDMLMHAFEDESKNRKITKMALSVKPANARAIAAYQKAGWQKEKESDTSLDMSKIVV